MPTLQMTVAEGRCFAGTSPYPGFVNLASTCWIISVLQCLFHCDTVREALAGKEHGDAQSCAMQLAQLLRSFVDGEAMPELSVSHAKLDIIAPHEFVDFVMAVNPRFVLGLQEDAAEFDADGSYEPEAETEAEDAFPDAEDAETKS